MYKLFTDKTELFECDIQLEGASLKNSQARLIIESPEVSLLFKGEITSGGKCKIPVKKLRGLIDENTQGNIKLEVIAEDTYFTPWESKFKVETSRKVTVEVKSQETENLITETKPQVSVNNIKDNVTIQEKEHILKLMRLLIKEDITLKNIKIKKNRLNNIVGTYIQENQVIPDQHSTIINGLIQGLAKLR